MRFWYVSSSSNFPAHQPTRLPIKKDMRKLLSGLMLCAGFKPCPHPPLKAWKVCIQGQRSECYCCWDLYESLDFYSLVSQLTVSLLGAPDIVSLQYEPAFHLLSISILLHFIFDPERTHLIHFPTSCISFLKHSSPHVKISSLILNISYLINLLFYLINQPLHMSPHSLSLSVGLLSSSRQNWICRWTHLR